MIVITLFITACGRSDPAENAQERGSNNENTAISSSVISDPAEIISYIQNAILIDSLELLKTLCDPDSSRSRSNTASKLCNISSDGIDEITQCKDWFSNSWVVEDIIYNNDTAWIRTILDGVKKQPLLILEKSNESWYLIDMKLTD